MEPLESRETVGSLLLGPGSVAAGELAWALRDALAGGLHPPVQAGTQAARAASDGRLPIFAVPPGRGRPADAVATWRVGDSQTVFAAVNGLGTAALDSDIGSLDTADPHRASTEEGGSGPLPAAPAGSAGVEDASAPGGGTPPRAGGSAAVPPGSGPDAGAIAPPAVTGPGDPTRPRSVAPPPAASLAPAMSSGQPATPSAEGPAGLGDPAAADPGAGVAAPRTNDGEPTATPGGGLPDQGGPAAASHNPVIISVDPARGLDGWTVVERGGHSGARGASPPRRGAWS